MVRSEKLAASKGPTLKISKIIVNKNAIKVIKMLQ
jgi:hypothetical protein